MSKKRSAVAAAFIVIGVVVLGLAAAVYAKYVASVTANGGTASVAVWKFEDDNSGSGNVSCDLTGTYNANTLVNGKIAPGTTGSCTIVIKNLQSEVGVRYTVKLGTIQGAPQNLIFKNHSTGATITASDSISDTLNINSTATVVIDWEWPYETGAGATVADEDEEDTQDGEAADTMSISFDIEGVQVNPTTL